MAVCSARSQRFRQNGNRGFRQEARALGIEILSTGGSAKNLTVKRAPVRDVSEIHRLAGNARRSRENLHLKFMAAFCFAASAGR